MRVLLLVLLLNLCCHGRYIEEITNKEHWVDLIQKEDGSADGARYGLLVVYKASDRCNQALKRYNFETLGDGLPDSRFLLIGRYDIVLRPRQTWYIWSEDYNLESFLKISDRDVDDECPIVFLFDVSNPRDPVRYRGSPSPSSLKDWVWDRLKVDVEFTNEHDKAVEIRFLAQDGQSSRVSQLMPQESRMYNTFISHRFYAKEVDSGDFVAGWDIQSPRAVAITQSHPKTTEQAWMASLAQTDQSDLKDETARIWSHSRRHIYNYKIPPLIPRFTETGYEKRLISESMCRMLKDFYQDNKDRHKVVETWHKTATEINFAVQKTNMIYLPAHMRKQIAEELQPIMEEWCQCDLMFETLYGIREYYNNSILKNHVDRIETHIVSGIIQVAQDVEEDWELEVVDFKGEKKFVKQYPCELVLYESSKIIHGRPTPLKGRHYSSAFIHFKPRDVNSWPYKTSSDNIIHTVDDKIPCRPENIIGKPFRGRNIWRRNNAFEFKSSMKDEL